METLVPEPTPEPAERLFFQKLTLPPGAIPLSGALVTVRPSGVNVRVEPSLLAEKLGKAEGNTRLAAAGLIFSDHTWLLVSWPDSAASPDAWIAGEYTDFSRSRAYSQVSDEWYETEAVLNFRRSLVRDLLRVRGADGARIAQAERLSGAELTAFEDSLTRPTIPPAVARFWQMREHLGLPDLFDLLPVHTAPPAEIETLEFSGFGPNNFALENWPVYYEGTRGLHNGVDYMVPEGSPLIAVADGQIVPFRFLANAAERSLALRPYLPEQYRAADGSRLLSNVIVAYGHLTGDPTSQLVKVGDDVRAGQIIGTSGWPVYIREDGGTEIQSNNAHLHLEVHLVTDGTRNLGSRTPLNPLLFWSPRWIAIQARLAARSGHAPYPASGQPWGRLGFFSLGGFSYEPSSIVWNYEPTREALWPPGVYDLDGLIALAQTFAPYEA
ncbi:MAG: M23 family metallopeptidase [Chloroflexi bacterium]|nr:M23 family metallopeptidase [Chloroflexota bacterium]